MRISDVLTLAGGAGEVIPATPSLTCASKKNPARRSSGLPTDSLSCTCPAVWLCCAASLGALQTTPWEPSGMLLREERPIG